MSGRPTAAHEAAKAEYQSAPKKKKPSARQLAAKHGLSESTIHRAPWYKPAPRPASKNKEKAQ